ncbi:UDP-N-acetylmuramoylalanyl-D-glutamate--2,6-diaminopimelate ligase [Halomicronema hongdechloris C2206]|uniref:UDP-N-acetylmuramate--L-alanine ligase n=1 Tax=Halomicronema hongdechloris C2206 TaxID=1641165 RepID=A0A1Z3HRI6_9CYAN|nr:UDP-N-acetylmuramate--L-alanine ligase [Halomicronema hongdechloris]ASC72866.1 UDP-N-acetylmuramoylalanyl-D-glutamate--2,6-diaminopimelate ligase [Halomicronema hongdechloris C2206]
MPNAVDFSGRPFHFIGIGGIGMSALAYILTKRQIPVSGSDLKLSHITQRLQEAGAHIFWKQEAVNLSFFQNQVASVAASGAPTIGMDGGRQLPQVVCSTAINESNPEYRAAIELGCPILHRSDVLAALIDDAAAIAVAGTHGKTTTSSMIGQMLLQADLDPTIVVGGEVTAWEGNARLGSSDYLVAEADESDGSLVKLAAMVGVVTNIELDHTDHYQNLDEVIHIFQTFERQCRVLVGCIDCVTVRQALTPVVTYSLHPESGADYVADSICYGATGTSALILERGQPLGKLSLQVLGQHNLSNALAAIAVGRHLGLPFTAIATGLSNFRGARRRFEHRGVYHNIRFIDDYAHHPSEIRATLAAARLQSSDVATGKEHRVIAVFQPHRYSRIAAFLPEFSQAFADADRVIVTDIYSAGEVNQCGLSGKDVAETIAIHHDQVDYQATLAEVQQRLTSLLEPGDLVIFLGAGNLNQIIPSVMAFYADIEAEYLHKACS